MDTKRQFQLELFKSPKYQPDSPGKDKYRPNFFAFIRLYEKAILILIIFFITSVISFSMGVEKGKRLTAEETQSKKEQAQSKKEQAQSKKEQAQSKKPATEKILLATPTEAQKDISGYTIQVATFKTKTYAQKEAKRLEKKGIEARIIPSGDFVCVCVGNFPGKHKARETLNQLKKTYHDCYIRRL